MMPYWKPKSKRTNNKKDNPILTVNAFAVLFSEPLFFPNENKAVNKLTKISIKKIIMINLISMMICPVVECIHYAARKFNLQF
ncbi:MAG: hypothetical protein RLZZ391_649 [Bacteroidota bacterium]|jgi:hypothetical protein